MTQNFKFRDLDLDFLAHPATGDIVGKTDVDAVRRAVRNLILFRKGDKPFHPEIASGVKDILFEPAVPITAIRLQTEITRVIKTYEPRVLLDKVGVNYTTDGNSFIIDIQFTVQNTLKKGSVTFNLERLR